MADATGSSTHARGVALCLIAAGGFASMALMGKGAYAAGVSVATLLALRFTLSAGVLWALVARVRPRRPARRDALLGLSLGALVYALECGAFFAALERLDASLTAVISYAYPALVVGGAVALRREAPTARRAGALALAAAGVVLVVTGGGGVGAGGLDPAGVALALAAATGYALYILCSASVVDRVAPLRLAALVTTGSAVAFWVAGAATGTLDLRFGAGGWLAVAGLAVCCTIVPITAFLAALPHVGAGTASILSTVEPVITVLLAVVILGDRLAAAQVLGGALVLGAVLVLELRRRRVPGAGRGTRVRGHVPPPPAAGPAPAREVARVAA